MSGTDKKSGKGGGSKTPGGKPARAPATPLGAKLICSRIPSGPLNRWIWSVSAKRVLINIEPSASQSSKIAERAFS